MSVLPPTGVFLHVPHTAAEESKLGLLSHWMDSETMSWEQLPPCPAGVCWQVTSGERGLRQDQQLNPAVQQVTLDWTQILRREVQLWKMGWAARSRDVLPDCGLQCTASRWLL